MIIFGFCKHGRKVPELGIEDKRSEEKIPDLRLLAEEEEEEGGARGREGRTSKSEQPQKKRGHDLSHRDGRSMTVGKTWQGSRHGLCVVSLEETIDRVWQGCVLRLERGGWKSGLVGRSWRRTVRELGISDTYLGVVYHLGPGSSQGYEVLVVVDTR